MKTAMELFDQMKQIGIQPDSTTYTILFTGCAESNNLTLGRSLHSEMKNRKISISTEIVNSLINMYSKCGSIEEAKSIFEYCQKEEKLMDVITWSSMINAYGIHGFGE